MAPKSEARNSEKKYPSLIITVLTAVVARNRELEHDNAHLRNELSEQNFARLDEKMSETRDLTLRLDEAGKHSTTLLRRAVTAEKALQREKDMHKLTEDALSQEIDNSLAKDWRNDMLNPSKKRGREADDTSDRPTKKSKHATIVCVECYKSKTLKKCDGSSPCWPCEYRGKECKRMRCKYFAAGTCRIKNCTMAHSDSGFPEESLEPNHHVAQSLEPAPVIPLKTPRIKKTTKTTTM